MCRELPSEPSPSTGTHPWIMTVSEAIGYQRDVYGRVVFGRDALYAVARAGRVPVVRVGQHRLLFPRTTIDRLLSGQETPAERMP